MEKSIVWSKVKSGSNFYSNADPTPDDLPQIVTPVSVEVSYSV